MKPLVAILTLLSASLLLACTPKGETGVEAEQKIPALDPAPQQHAVGAISQRELQALVGQALRARGPLEGERLPFISEVPGIIEREGDIDEWVMETPELLGTPLVAIRDDAPERVYLVWVPFSLEGMLMPRGIAC